MLSKGSKNIWKILPCRFKQPFGLLNMLAVHKCSVTGLFRHLNKLAFSVYNLRKKSPLRLIIFFQVFGILIRLRKCSKKLRKSFFDFVIIALELLALDTRFYWGRIFVIGWQYVNKHIPDLRYYYNRVFRADFFSEWSKKVTKLLACRFKQSFGPFNILTVHKCSGTGLFRHLSSPTFCSL